MSTVYAKPFALLSVATMVPAILAAAVCSCQQGGCGGTESPAAARDAGLDAPADVIAPPDAGDADASPCPDPTIDIPPDIPEGWVRAPCAPVDCDIYLAPDASLALPPSPWADCGEGCLELVHDWGDPKDRFFGALGASGGSVRYLNYTRNLGGGPLEMQTVRLPDNTVTFNALLPGFNKSCHLSLRAFSADLVVLETMLGTDDPAPNRSFTMIMSPEEAMPRIAYEHTDYDVPLEAVATQDLWAVTFGRYEILWHPPEPGGEMLVAWQSPDNRLAYSLGAAGSTVFFSTERAVSYDGSLAFEYETLAWDPTEGARVLLSFADAPATGACCMRSDGVDMVWLQGNGYDPDSHTFSSVELMTSPFATHAAQLQPRSLRTVYQNHLIGAEGVVGAGYALYWESKKGAEKDYQHALTRLADGAYWIIEPRPGFIWGTPLYLDGEEIALLEGAGKEVFIDAGLHSGESYTMVRYSIASLGTPTLP